MEVVNIPTGMEEGNKTPYPYLHYNFQFNVLLRACVSSITAQKSFSEAHVFSVSNKFQGFIANIQIR